MDRESPSKQGPRNGLDGETVATHLKGILGYWRFRKASNAATEGFNNKIRWLIKQAYGYRDYKYFRFDLPNLKTTKSDVRGLGSDMKGSVNWAR